MQVFIVSRDREPFLATFDMREACRTYESTVRSGRFREATVVAIPTKTDDHQVLLSAFQAR